MSERVTKEQVAEALEDCGILRRGLDGHWHPFVDSITKENLADVATHIDIAALAPSERAEAVAWAVRYPHGDIAWPSVRATGKEAIRAYTGCDEGYEHLFAAHLAQGYSLVKLYEGATLPAPEEKAEPWRSEVPDSRLAAEMAKQASLGHKRFCVGIHTHDDGQQEEEWVEWSAAFAHLRASSPPAAAAEGEDAENFRALKRLMAVGGAGWSVRHPREDDGQWYFGFGFPMTGDEVRGAIERGGLGWAPSLEGALRNAADTIDAARAPRKGDSDVQ